MPYSDPALRPWIAAELFARAGTVTTVIDVGAGAGQLRDFLGPAFPAARWYAVEIWEPYVGRFDLVRRYDGVIVADIRTVDPYPAADVYLLGDVIEHMPAEDAVTVWGRARAACRWLALSLPVLPYPQGPEFGNPHEEHVHQWDMDSVLETFPGIVAWSPPAVHLVPRTTTGAFIAEGLA